MSLAFPTTPSVGQIASGFMWDGARWTSPWAVRGSLVNSFNGRVGAVMPDPSDIQTGNKVLLSTTVVSAAVASVDFFSGFDGTYDELALNMFDVAPAAENVPQIRCSQDGSTFTTGATDYNYMWNHVCSNNTSGFAGAAGAGSNLGPAIGNAAAHGLFCQMRFRISPTGSPSSYWNWQSVFINAASGAFAVTGSGRYGPAAACKGIRFSIATGANITRGTFKLYGIVK
jgi:hypothetical protein